MNKFSNVLKIPVFSDLYKDTINRIAQKSKELGADITPPTFTEKKFEDVMMVDSPTVFVVTYIDENGNKYTNQYTNINIQILIYKY